MEILSTLFSSIKVAKCVGQYFGIIESLDIKIDKLIQNELNTGILNLEQAINSDQENISLLRDARFCFNKAINLEKKERLFIAYVGLALIHFLLDDISNMKLILKKIADTNIENFISSNKFH
jgi:hypothetical protein